MLEVVVDSASEFAAVREDEEELTLYALFALGGEVDVVLTEPEVSGHQAVPRPGRVGGGAGLRPGLRYVRRRRGHA